MSDKKDLLEELAEMGLDEEIIDRIRDWNAASPLRKVANSASKRAEQAEAERDKYRAIAMNTAFQKAGIRVNPSLLNVPNDLDILNDEAMKKWAVDNGLVDNSPSVDEEEFEAHDEINNLNAGGDPPSSSILTPLAVSEWPADRWIKFAKEHPEAAEQLKRGEEVRNVSTRT